MTTMRTIYATGRRPLPLLLCVLGLLAALLANSGAASAQSRNVVVSSAQVVTAHVSPAGRSSVQPAAARTDFALAPATMSAPAAVSSTFKFPYGCPSGATCLYLHDNAVGRNGQNVPDNEYYYCKPVNMSGYDLHSGSIVNNNTGNAQAEIFYGKNGTNPFRIVNAGGAFNMDLYPLNSIEGCIPK